MDEAAFEWACKQLGEAIYIAYHDGEWDNTKPLWEQPYEGIQIAWERISRGCYRDILLKRLGTANEEWNRNYAEAYRQSVERFKAREGYN
jgi:hypothetical protein